MYEFLRHFPLDARQHAARECGRTTHRTQEWFPGSLKVQAHPTWRTPDGSCPLAVLLSRVGLRVYGSPGPGTLAIQVMHCLRQWGVRYDALRLEREVDRFVYDVDMGRIGDLCAAMCGFPAPEAPRPRVEGPRIRSSAHHYVGIKPLVEEAHDTALFAAIDAHLAQQAQVAVR